MAFAIFNITDGTTTISIMNSAATQGSYRMVYGKFAPPVSKKKVDFLKRDLPFEPLVWDITLNIHGSSAPDAYTKLASLISLLHKVSDWIDNDYYVSPVLVNYQPNGSTLATVNQTIIKSVEAFDLPQTFEDTGTNFVLLGCRIRFRTIGAQLGAIDTVVTASLPSLTLHNITVPDHNIDSPFDVIFTGANVGPATVLNSSPLYVWASAHLSGTQKKLYRISANVSGVPTANWAFVADAAGNYPPNNMARLTPPAANTAYLAPSPSLGTAPDGKDLDVWVIYRVNGAGRTFTIRAGYLNPLDPASGTGTFTTSVKVTSNTPALAYVGKVKFPYPPLFGGSLIYDASVDSITGGPTLDVMTIIAQVDDQYASFLEINLPFTPMDMSGQTVNVQHKLLSKVNASVSAGPTELLPLAYDGSAYLVQRGTGVAVLLFAPQGNAWRLFTSAAAVFNLTCTVKRQRAYAAPQ